MKHKLEQAMEEVRDDFIQEAAAYKKKRRFAPWLGAVAAVLAVVLIACAKSGVFHVLAMVLPLIFVRPTLTIAEFFRKKGA